MTITAKIIADSISPKKDRITTFELEYPRFIHSEFMTHRLFSRNAASSRAIPVSKAIDLIRSNTAMPVHWGKNVSGMSAKEECNEMIGHNSHSREEWWRQARDASIMYAEGYSKAGYHKQIVNRITEPFSHIKVICTATEYDNFFWLRYDEGAQPELYELARVMKQAKDNSHPVILGYDDWHVPYYQDGYWRPMGYSKTVTSGNTTRNVPIDGGRGNRGCTLDQALAVSSSCCAQVSYRKLDDTLDKAQSIYDRLITSLPPHFSPMEHQATPMPFTSTFYVDGITHQDRNGAFWSGNFKGWIQHRQLIMTRLKLSAMTSVPSNNSVDK